MLCSYRGYGRSQGQPNEAGIKLDAQAALEHLLERKDVNKDLVSMLACMCTVHADQRQNISNLKPGYDNNTICSKRLKPLHFRGCITRLAG